MNAHTNRRRFVGALAAAPIAIAAAGPVNALVPVDASAWDRALAEFRATETSLDGLYDAWDESDERGAPDASSAYEDMQAAQPAYNAARDALMAISAPHHAALLVKVELAFQSLDNDHAESALADARRLLATTGRAA